MKAKSHPRMTDAERSLASAHYRLAWKIARQVHTVLGGDLDTILSDALWELCLLAQWYDPNHPKVGTFLATAAAALRRRLLGKYVRHRPLVVPYPEPIAPKAPDHVEIIEQVDVVRTTLTADEFGLLWQWAVDGIPHSTLARHAGMSRATIQARCSELCRKAREYLDEGVRA